LLTLPDSVTAQHDITLGKHQFLRPAEAGCPSTKKKKMKYGSKDPKGRKWKNRKRQREHDKKE
jgi:hypothetical protein